MPQVYCLCINILISVLKFGISNRFAFTPVVAADIIGYACRKAICLYYLIAAVAGVGRHVVTNGNLRICADVTKADNAVADICKVVARDYDCLMIYRFGTRLNGDSVVTGGIEVAAGYGDSVNLLGVNALEAVIKRAVFNGKIFHLSVIALVIITQSLTV